VHNAQSISFTNLMQWHLAPAQLRQVLLHGEKKTKNYAICIINKIHGSG